MQAEDEQFTGTFAGEESRAAPPAAKPARVAPRKPAKMPNSRNATIVILSIIAIFLIGGMLLITIGANQGARSLGIFLLIFAVIWGFALLRMRTFYRR